MHYTLIMLEEWLAFCKQTRYNDTHMFKHYHASRSAVILYNSSEWLLWFSSIGCVDIKISIMTVSWYRFDTTVKNWLTYSLDKILSVTLSVFVPLMKMISDKEKSAAARLKKHSCGILFRNESVLLNESSKWFVESLINRDCVQNCRQLACYLINDFKGNISWSCLKGSSDVTCTFTSWLNWNVCWQCVYTTTL